MMAEESRSLRRSSERHDPAVANAQRGCTTGPRAYSPKLRTVIAKCNRRRSNRTVETHETYETYILRMLRSWENHLHENHGHDIYARVPTLPHFTSMLIEFCEQQQVHSSNLDYHRMMCAQVQDMISDSYRMLELEQILRTKPSMKFEESLKRVPIDQFRCIHTNSNCSVCMESLMKSNAETEGLIRLPCKHTFHAPCLKKWLNIKQSCPICRSEDLQGAIQII
jgi:hypothetical protein